MALARCERCGVSGLKHSYPHLHTPIGSPSAALLCGAPHCVRPGCLWLTEVEEQQYLLGLRSFRLSNRAQEVQVI
jgi:hypothetical protein